MISLSCGFRDRVSELVLRLVALVTVNYLMMKWDLDSGWTTPSTDVSLDSDLERPAIAHYE